MGKSDAIPGIPVELEVEHLGDIRIGAWRFRVYRGDTIPWGADGVTDTRTGCIVIGEHLATGHEWPVFCHEFFEAVAKCWHPSLDVDHPQIQILGEVLASSFPDLMRMWWSLAPQEERKAFLYELLDRFSEDGDDDESAGESFTEE